MKLSPTVFRRLAIAWTVIMLIGCLTPHDHVPDELATWNDKFLHVVIFAPFSFLWILTGFRVSNALLAGFIFGALIELLQYILPINRSADWKDVVGDGIGTLLGAGLTFIWYRLFPNGSFTANP